MTYSSPARRPRLIAGLRDLADFLDIHSELPDPYSVDVSVFVPKNTDQAMRAEVDRIAVLLGTQIDPEQLIYDHYSAGLDFGPVRYRLIAILAGARARHEALSSYFGAVVPDAPEEV